MWLRICALWVAMLAAACSLKHPADVNDDGGVGGCGGTCTTAQPVCTAGTCGPCTTESECLPYAVAGEPHCSSVGTCVACRDSNDCAAATPTCDMGVCRGCKDDSECASNACEVHSGTCLAESETLYVDASKSNLECSKEKPCPSISYALSLVTGTKKFIKVAAGKYTGALAVNGVTVTIIGRGAELSVATQSAAAIDVDNSAKLTVLDLHILGAFQGDGVRCTPVSAFDTTVTLQFVDIDGANKFGVDASDCAVTLEQSFIHGNVLGGLKLFRPTAFVVRNNMIVLNGGVQPGVLGGVYLNQGITTTSVFEFNTITHNGTNTMSAGGIQCDGAVVLRNNVIYQNVHDTGGYKEVDGGCTHRYSDIGPDGSPDTTDINVDPLFVQPSADDFTLDPQSPVRGMADPTATLTIDFQGEPRPQGTGREPGADEIP